MRSVAKRVLPADVRALGSRSYLRLCTRWLGVTVGYHTPEKIIALTFDDGPNPVFTPLVLDALAQHGAKATFFMIGQHVQAHPQLVQRVVTEGHVVGNHTFSHPLLIRRLLIRRLLIRRHANDVVHELRACQRAIGNVTGQRTAWMRPPYGLCDHATHAVTRLQGYRVVNWSLDAIDWRGDDAAMLTRRVVNTAMPGAIVLMHDGWNDPQSEWPEQELVRDRTATVQALPGIITQLKSDGYQFATLTELAQGRKPIRKLWQ